MSRSWCRVVSCAGLLFTAGACGDKAEQAARVADGGSAGAPGVGATGGSGGSPGTGAVGPAWIEVIQPFPELVPAGAEPGSVTSETQICGSSVDGSVLVGSSWSVAVKGDGQQRNAAFRWTLEGGRFAIGDLAAMPTRPMVFPEKVSGDGSVIAGSIGPGVDAPIFHWTEDSGLVDIGKLGAGSSLALGDLSADGSVIVGTADSSMAFRWTADTGIAALGVLPGMERSSGLAVSADGGVVFGASGTDAGNVLFRWTAKTGIEALDWGCEIPQGGRLAPGSVGHDGSTLVGACTSEQGLQAYQWSAGTGVKSLGRAPEGFDSITLRFANAEAGVLIAQATGPNRDDYQALRATAASGFMALGVLPGNPSCNVLGSSFDAFPSPRSPMSADGSVVAGNCINTGAGTAVGFRWSEATGIIAMRPLPGHARTHVTSISPEGILAGTSSGDGLEREAVLWDEHGDPRSIRALLESSGVDLGGFLIDDVVVVGGGRTLYGAGKDAVGAGRSWAAQLP